MSDQNAQNPKRIIDWLENEDRNIITRKSGLIFNILPYISLLSLLLDIFLFKNIHIPMILYIIQFMIFCFYYKRIIDLFNTFENNSKVLNTYANIIKKIESTKFHSQTLQNMQKELSNSEEIAASKIIAEISSILEKSDLRYNTFIHFIVNSFWLWDIKCAIKATRWKKKNWRHVRKWLETIGHFEKLSSLSIIAFEHPSWSFPAIDSQEIEITAKNIRHPLIFEKINIGNDFSLNPQRHTIITGSNMSGKSTFLRTIGINLVLSYTGAPVCSDEMNNGIFLIYTSMCKRDNLKKNISTFFSELIRIKNIVDIVHTGEKTIYLIDEIFSGTNSHDKIAGAKSVLHALQLENTLGIISTHDLEICNLSNGLNSKFVNYHFREYYEDNNIKFEYKIHAGPSKTRNALFLAKMVGIPISVLEGYHFQENPNT